MFESKTWPKKNRNHLDTMTKCKEKTHPNNSNLNLYNLWKSKNKESVNRWRLFQLLSPSSMDMPYLSSKSLRAAPLPTKPTKHRSRRVVKISKVTSKDNYFMTHLVQIKTTCFKMQCSCKLSIQT